MRLLAGDLTAIGPVVLIVSQANDLHALLIQHELRERFGSACHLIEYDSLSGGGLCWRPDGSSWVRDHHGGSVDVASAHACWWRRIGVAQSSGSPSSSEVSDLIGRNSYSAITGLFCTSFRGAWVSSPLATGLASNKLVQLAVAHEAGMSVPETIVSNVPTEIRSFAAAVPAVVVKPLQGLGDRTLFTRLLSDDDLADDRALVVAPAIYQARVPASGHLRVNIFGDQLHAFRIVSPQLDWRMAPNAIEVCETRVDPDLRSRLLRIQDALGLEMSVHDLIVGPTGDPVWLEVNPQGQFLFLEGLTGAPLTLAFSEFLWSRATDSGAFR